MPDQLLTLQQLIEQFEVARDTADWGDVARLNEQTRAVVEAEMKRNHGEPLRLKPELERLSELYQVLQNECIRHRDAAATAVQQHQKQRSGADHYTSTSTL